MATWCSTENKKNCKREDFKILNRQSKSLISELKEGMFIRRNKQTLDRNEISLLFLFKPSALSGFTLYHICYQLHKKWSFPLKISSVNVTKFAGNCGFGHIYWRNPEWKTSFFVQWSLFILRKITWFLIRLVIVLFYLLLCKLENRYTAHRKLVFKQKDIINVCVKMI